jgi:hypothetical protein
MSKNVTITTNPDGTHTITIWNGPCEQSVEYIWERLTSDVQLYAAGYGLRESGNDSFAPIKRENYPAGTAGDVECRDAKRVLMAERHKDLTEGRVPGGNRRGPTPVSAEIKEMIGLVADATAEELAELNALKARIAARKAAPVAPTPAPEPIIESVAEIVPKEKVEETRKRNRATR